MIPLEDLKNGRVYQLRSRNLAVGVWRASTRGFIGIRQKFGSSYLFEEFHYDNGPPFGTAVALVDLEVDARVPGKYWLDDKGLFKVLQPLDQAVAEQREAEFQLARLEGESLKWRPQTKDEYDKELRVAEVRAWWAGVEDKRGRQEEWIQRLESAIRGDDV